MTHPSPGQLCPVLGHRLGIDARATYGVTGPPPATALGGPSSRRYGAGIADPDTAAAAGSRLCGALDRSTGRRCAAGISTLLCSTMASAAPTSSTSGSPASYREVYRLTDQPCLKCCVPDRRRTTRSDGE